MGGIHFTQVINDCIELSVYSDGAVTYQEAINIGADETPYLIHIYRKHYEAKEKAKQDIIKAGFEYATKAFDQLFKLLSQLGKTQRGQ
jgi:hypothetical protein